MKFRNKKLSKDFKSNFKLELCFIELWNYGKTQATKFWRILFHETIKPRSQRDAPDRSLRKHISAVNGQYSAGMIRADNEAW